MPNLEGVSVEEMRAVIEKREQDEKLAAMAVPTPLQNPDFAPLVQLCKGYIEDLNEFGVADEDYNGWMFESAMSAVFGPNIWEWINLILIA